jgi:PIN domain nuclease of toxin-antitoxin system
VRLLLDTHVLLWWFIDDRRLSRSARLALQDRGNRIFVSAASAWELEIKVAKGKLRLPAGGDARIHSAMLAAGFEELSVTVMHAFAIRSLPRMHADPFDRLLAAQCQAENLTLVTNDRLLRRYPIDHFW